MKFILSGRIEASSELDQLREVIAEALKRAEETVLRKGVPKGQEGAHVLSWSIEGKFIRISIEGSRWVRAHVALKRLQKFLAEQLARYRVGVRRVYCDEYVIELPRPFNEKIVENLHYYDKVKHVEVSDAGIKIVLQDLTETELERGDIDRLIRLVTSPPRTIRDELAGKVGKVIAQSPPKKHYLEGNPTELAEKLGWAIRFPGRAQWIYLPPMAALIRAIRDIFYEYVAKPLGFIEVLFPKLIPIEIAFRARKLQGEPGGMYYVCVPRYREKEKYIPFQIKAEITQELPMDELKKLLEEPSYILDPIQCLPFYQLYRGRVLKKEDLPIKVVECGGPTYRFEAGGARGLERVDEFWRMEHVWLGLPEQCIEIRNEIMKKVVEVVDRVLDLEWRIQFAGDTFFLAEDQRIDEDIQIPSDPKYELQIYLPYRGPRDSTEKDVWLACASFNLAGNHYTKYFGIKCATGEVLWTGCCGIGLTRMALAFIAQKGFDPSNWPEEVRKRVGEIKKLPGL